MSTAPGHAELTVRQRRLWGLHDFSQGRGLEIGPLHSATVPRGSADVFYVDVRDRAGLVAYYASHPRVDTDLIPEIDFALLDEEGTARPLSEAAAPAAPYDWVMASHVIEHVPDLVGWLAQVADLVADGGRLVLAVPDRRYTFDAHRPPTTIGQVLEAHEARATRPSVRAVYDHLYSAVNLDRQAAWRGRHPDYGSRRFNPVQTQEAIDRVRAGEYVDCHVWMFTTGELVEQLTALRKLGLSSWEVERAEPTARRQHEFYLVLRRRPRDPAAAGDPAGLTDAEREHGDRLPTWLAREHELQDRIEALKADRARARDRVRVTRARAERARALAERRLRRIERLEAELVAGPAGALRRVEGVTRRGARQLVGAVRRRAGRS